MRKSEEMLENLEIYASDFKEKLKEYVDRRIYELVAGDCDIKDNATYNAVQDIAQEKIDCAELCVSAQNVDGLDDYIADSISTPEISAEDIIGLNSAVKNVVENLSFDISVS